MEIQRNHKPVCRTAAYLIAVFALYFILLGICHLTGASGPDRTCARVLCNFASGLSNPVKPHFWPAFCRSFYISDATDYYNWFEVALWGWSGLFFLGYGLSRGGYYFYQSTSAGILLIFFSLSDAMELVSGVWWTPWWLFVWKAINTVAIIAVYLWYKHDRGTEPKEQARH